LKIEKLRKQFDLQFREFNRPGFIAYDPVGIPHLFTAKPDIEISGFFAATLAWGQRKTIIHNCTDLLQRMDYAPHEFILSHTERDLGKLINFKHRTFNSTDLLYFVYALKKLYGSGGSLESAFSKHLKKEDETIENALKGFHRFFFDDENAPARTKKHVSTPEKRSACKRLCMYLRWMVRKDDQGVDFGIWNTIKPAQLVCPIDVHVERVARKFKLITRKQTDWECALELTAQLKRLDPDDPVKYDFALFGMSAFESVYFSNH